jgi:exonuclease III
MDSIISWNIAGANGLLGRKTDDLDFVKIINGNDVICLQETGTEVILPGYESFNDLRKSGGGGGVTTLVRRKLLNRCKSFENMIPSDRSMNTIVTRVSQNDGNVLL